MMKCFVNKRSCPGWFNGECLSIENCQFQWEDEVPAKKKMVDLFAGKKSVSNAFEKCGWETFAVEWDKDLPNIDWYTDIGKISAKDIILAFGVPDVIWASPDCTTYSVAAISRHRRKEENGNLAPVSEYAQFCDEVNKNVIKIIEDLLEINPNLIYFIENPRGGMRKMDFMQGLPRYTVTYCQYGDTRMKPTDIWTNHPDPKFKPTCKNGDKCHEPAPRGSRTGTQGIDGKKDRSVIPKLLCEHIVNICMEVEEDE